MLRYDTRDFRHGSVPVQAVVPQDDPVFEGLGITLHGPVTVTGELQAAPRGTFVWRGSVSGSVAGECRRCLAPVEAAFAADVRAIYTADEEVQDDAGVYPLPESVTVLDLSEAVREEIGLAAPSLLLCREDCAGLCARCGSDLNEGPCQCGDPEPR